MPRIEADSFTMITNIAITEANICTVIGNPITPRVKAIMSVAHSVCPTER